MRTVVITGGNGDIAQAIKRELTAEYLVLAPGKEELDVTDISNVTRFFKKNHTDILINNAGYVVPMSIASCDILSEKRAIDVNLFGVFNCTSAVLQNNKWAKIINIGSSAATKVHGTWSSYCASKAGVVMASRCWAENGYDVVCISPGRTDTKMRTALFPDEDKKTLLTPQMFARVVKNAVLGKFKSGEHINVTKDNVEDILK